MKILNSMTITECNTNLIGKLFISFVTLFILGTAFFTTEKIKLAAFLTIIDAILLFMLVFAPFVTDGYYIKNQYEVIVRNDYPIEEIEKIYEKYDVYICDDGKWVLTDKEWVRANN